MSELKPEQKTLDHPAQEQPQVPAEIKYEGDPRDQIQKALSCDACKITFDFKVTRGRIVKFCPCCGRDTSIPLVDKSSQ